MLTSADLARIDALRPELRAVAVPFIEDVEAATGKAVHIPPRGGKRSNADQWDLWNDRANNPYPVAQPGTSRHEYAGALDINITGGTNWDYAIAAEIADIKYFLDPGLYFTTPDRVHFQLRESFNDAKAGYALMLQQHPGDVITTTTTTAPTTKTLLIAGVLVLGVVVLFSDQS